MFPISSFSTGNLAKYSFQNKVFAKETRFPLTCLFFVQVFHLEY